MRVTVCELNDSAERFARDWKALGDHLHQHQSQFLLLPEMPFSPWFATENKFNPAIWERALYDHERAEELLKGLGNIVVGATRPRQQGERRFNQGFLWNAGTGIDGFHHKSVLPDEFPVWEASWYHRGEDALQLQSVGEATVGYLICTEIWFFEKARAHGRNGADLLLTPRKTGAETLAKWVVAGQAAAITAGAYSLSSNSVGGPNFGGQGWMIDPNGNILGLTSAEKPFLTLDIDLEIARTAKFSYPRNVS